MKKLFTKGKKLIMIALIATVGAGSIGYVDNYFEISKNMEILNEIYRELHIYYVDDTNPGELMQNSINGMLKSLDPYTTYIPEADIESYRFMTTGQYGGIGALIRKEGGRVMIAEPYEGFPAHKAGLKAGDVIMEINGTDTEGKTTNDVSKILKGAPGTALKLRVKRNGSEILEKELNREEVKIPSVPYFGMVNEETGYIKCTSFTDNVSKEVRDAFVSLRDEQGMKSVILDLRGNGGGLLKEAVEIVNLFVDKGQEIVSTKGRIKEWDKKYVAKNTPLDTEIPVTVLVDGSSASASEIVSGAIQDLDRGLIIGEQTFGKGLVQQTRSLKYDTRLKLTVAKYYIPSGRCIQRIDYSHRGEDGKATVVPDSLIQAYKTRNGREVFDGKGIAPDVKIDLEMYSKITTTLAVKNYIFNYATQFATANPTIDAPNKFALTDAQYEDFKKYLEDKDISYETASEQALEELEEVATSEKYFEDAAAEFEALKAKLTPKKSNDLEKFKGEILELLESEIVSRYFYQNGRIEASLPKDPYIQEALSILADNGKYKGLLDGSVSRD